MPQGEIQIIEFAGHITEVGRDVTTHLLSIDGEFHKKYGKPTFGYLPNEWRQKYQVRSVKVGKAESWKDFFKRCTELVDVENSGPAATDHQPSVLR